MIMMPLWLTLGITAAHTARTQLYEIYLKEQAEEESGR
jgi:hypothetical protein